MEGAVQYDNMGDLLIESLPELRAAYDAELGVPDDDKPGMHVVYGDILVPYLITSIEHDEDEVLRRIFTLLEKLARSEDLQVQEVVAVTVCERLGDDRAWLTKARAYMGETTLRFSHEVEQFWGREPKT